MCLVCLVFSSIYFKFENRGHKDQDISRNDKIASFAYLLSSRYLSANKLLFFDLPYITALMYSS